MGVVSGLVAICISIRSVHLMSLLFLRLWNQTLEVSFLGPTLLSLKCWHLLVVFVYVLVPHKIKLRRKQDIATVIEGG